jgi:uncharacterized membrane protein YfcA
MLPLEPVLLALALVVVFIAAIAQGSIGMGFGQISAAGMIWIAPDMLPTVVILMALVVGLIGALREWSAIDIKLLSVSIAGRIAGTLLSVPLLILVSANNKSFALLFGVLVLISVGLSLVKAMPSLSNTTLVTGGIASGIMGTITSVGAPPMGLVFQHQKSSFARPTLNAFFAIGSVFSLLALWFAGRFTVEHILLVCYLIPGFVSGVYLSKYFHQFVDSRFRYLVLVFSSISAVALIVKSMT